MLRLSVNWKYMKGRKCEQVCYSFITVKQALVFRGENQTAWKVTIGNTIKTVMQRTVVAEGIASWSQQDLSKM